MQLASRVIFIKLNNFLICENDEIRRNEMSNKAYESSGIRQGTKSMGLNISPEAECTGDTVAISTTTTHSHLDLPIRDVGIDCRNAR